MTKHEHRAPMAHLASRRLLPKAGIGLAIVAFLAHFVGGGALMHLGLPALLVYFGLGAVPTSFGGAMLIALAAVIAIKLLFVLGAVRVVGGSEMLARLTGTRSGIPTKKTVHGAPSDDRHIAQKEDIMLVRTTKAQVQPGQLDEFARRWSEYVAPHVPEMVGLRAVYLCANRDRSVVMSIHLWESPPDQAAHETHDRAHFRDHVRDILASEEPVAEEFEVLAQG